jgi:glycosyltransferase involved in cell wall biosynthesis
MERARKVLHVITNREPRGAEIFAAKLAHLLEEGGRFASTVCGLYKADNSVATERVRFIQLEGRRVRGGLNPRLIYDLYRTMRNCAPHIILAHGSDTLKYTVLAGAFCGKVPIVYRNIGTASFWAGSKKKVVLTRLLLRRIAAVVSVSEFGRTDFIQHYKFSRERVVHIPNARAADQFDEARIRLARPIIRRALGIEEDIVLINVGSLAPEKNQRDLLRLTADLCASGVPAFLLLVGVGSLRQELERFSDDLGIADRTCFLGSRTDICDLLAASDIFVLTSRTEGMPGALIEAGLAALPSVSYAVGGVPEVVAHGATGVLVPPEDYGELVRAVAALCQNQDQRASMGRQARQTCLEHFDIAKVTLAYERLLTQVLTRTGDLRELMA